jgi:hypothetical protein
MRRDTGPFIKTARQGSTYATRGGRYFLRRQGARWIILERSPSWTVLGSYGTLAEAVSGFRTLEKDLPVSS